MKKITLLLLLTAQALVAMTQADNIHARDSCVQTNYWQVMVRAATLQDAYQLVADTSMHDAMVLRYSQMVIAQPAGVQYPATWVLAMSYGVMAQDPDVSCASDIYTVEHYVNLIFMTQAYAYYQQPPPSASASEEFGQRLNRIMKIGIIKNRN